MFLAGYIDAPFCQGKLFLGVHVQIVNEVVVKTGSSVACEIPSNKTIGMLYEEDTVELHLITLVLMKERLERLYRD